MREDRAPYYNLCIRRWIPLFVCVCLCGSLCQCVQTYISPHKSPPTGYLVVEGFISGNTPTRYSLTRSIELPGDSALPVVTGAMVQVEGSDSSAYVLPEVGNGVYGDTTLGLNPAVQYRLRIVTPDGNVYLSDFVPLKPAPPIDSVNWVYRSYNGVDIYVNTHDPANSTRYYRWDYDETWEYHSARESDLLYIPSTNSVVPRTPSQLVYHCWHDSPSVRINLANTSKLSSDDVYEYPLVHIPFGSQKLSVLYTILVTQYAYTEDAYNFYTQLLANTESLGTIFDLQPTQLKSNIRNVTNPNEPVIGYISAGTLQQQRIWIKYDQLFYWEYVFECQSNDREVTPDSTQYYFEQGYTPIGFSAGVYTANESYCVDCTIQGGVNYPPPYWPN